MPALEERAVDPAAPAAEPLWRGSATVLLVEDEEMIRRMTNAALKQLGYRVLQASNGVEAPAVWEAEGGRIDLLLTDMVMPEGISGLDLGLRLLRLKEDLKVVIVSGYSAALPYDEGPIEPSLEYLTKPYTLSRLSDVLRRTLGETDDLSSSPVRPG